MHEDKTVQRFIDLRVQGWPFARIAAELNVSKPTLIGWSRKHQHTIANLVAIEREERLNQLIQTTEERLSRLGAELKAAESELAKRGRNSDDDDMDEPDDGFGIEGGK